MRRPLGISLIVGFLVCASSSFGEDWRKPLTFKETGLYCGPGPEEQFDFYILQWDAQNLPLEWNVKQADDMVAELKSKGKKVIPRLYVWKTDTEKARPIEEYYKEVDAVLDNVHVDNLYAISLSEENITGKGHREVLEKLYDHVKGKWPDLPVYQWFQGMPPDVVGRKKADGYIIDPYWDMESEFHALLKKYLDLGKPVIDVIFAANQEGIERGVWAWSPTHLRVFEDQWRICKEHNIPVAFYCIGPFSSKLHRATLPWETEDPMVQALFKGIQEKMREAHGEAVDGSAWLELLRATDAATHKTQKPD